MSVVAMTTHPRVLIDVGPRMFATALARILTDRGYVVHLGADPDDHDLALVAEAAGEARRAAIQIVLPTLEGDDLAASITDARGSRRAAVRNLEDLLALIEGALLPNGAVP
jgi:hypothetical protein